jgi:type I restriction enzyme R subunit
MESGIGTAEDVEKATTQSNGLGLFVRSLVGMDRQAAKGALSAFSCPGPYGLIRFSSWMRS